MIETFNMRCPHFLVYGLFVLALLSCKKDGDTVLPEISFDLPADINLVYGKHDTIDLNTFIVNQGNGVNFSVGFEPTENVQITPQITLHNQLEKAIFIDKSGKLFIKSEELYPNGTTSSLNGKKIPAQYSVTVSAKSTDGKEVAQKLLSIRVLELEDLQFKYFDDLKKGQLKIFNIMYTDTDSYFTLTKPVPSKNLTLKLTEAQAKEVGLSLQDTALKLYWKGNANQEHDKYMELNPKLEKDGFAIGSASFSIRYIPKIEFFFGELYLDPSTQSIKKLSTSFRRSSVEGGSAIQPTFFPEKLISSFEISSIEKDGRIFSDTEMVFTIDKGTGMVSVKNNTSLKAGIYTLTLQANTTNGQKVITTLSLGLE